jgi:F0F1-type ATP synthase membrane subunit b/b'
MKEFEKLLTFMKKFTLCSARDVNRCETREKEISERLDEIERSKKN